MAQQVGYFENGTKFTEGPFVIVFIYGWRIEVELKGNYCTVLPDVSVYKLRKELGFPEGKFNDKEEAARLCDALNEKVREGEVVLRGNIWVCPKYEAA